MTATSYGSVANKTAGTTFDITTAVDIPAGTLLVVGMSHDNSASATLPTATLAWTTGSYGTFTQRASNSSGTSTSAGAGIFGRIWTAVAADVIPSGTVLRTTFSNSITAKAIELWGFDGNYVDTLRGTAGTGTSTGGAPSAATSGTALVAGDLVIGIIAGEDNAVPSGDSDTTNGSWSTIDGSNSSGASGATNCAVGMQWKIVNATGVQTYNATTSNDSVALIIACQPNPNATVTATTIAAPGAVLSPTLSASIAFTASAVRAGMSAAPVSISTYEVSTDGAAVSAGSGTLAVSTDYASSGVSSLKFIPTSGSPEVYFRGTTPSNGYAVTPGQIISASVQVRRDASADAFAWNLRVYFFNSSGTSLSSAPLASFTPSSSSFTSFSGSAVVPSSAAWALVYFEPSSAPTNTNPYYLDDFQVGINALGQIPTPTVSVSSYITAAPIPCGGGIPLPDVSAVTDATVPADTVAARAGLLSHRDDFEVDFGTITAATGTVVRSTDYAASGTYSAKATPVIGAQCGIRLDPVPGAVPGNFTANGGRQLQISFKARAHPSQASRLMQVAIGWNFADGSGDGDAVPVGTITDTAFTTCNLLWTLPADVATIYVEITTAGAVASNDPIYFDDVIVTLDAPEINGVTGILPESVSGSTAIPLPEITTEVPDATVPADVVSTTAAVPLPDGIPNYVTASIAAAVADVPAATLATGSTVAASVTNNETFTGTPGDTITTSNTTLDEAAAATFATNPGGRPGTGARLGSGTARGYYVGDLNPPIMSGKVFTRTYVYFDTVEAAYQRVFSVEDHQGAYLGNGWNTWSTGGELRLVSLTTNSGTNFAVSVGVWYRLELDVDYDAKTVQGRIYVGDSPTPVETQNVSWTTIARTNVNGQCEVIAIRRQNTGYTYFDDFAWSLTSQPGSTEFPRVSAATTVPVPGISVGTSISAAQVQSVTAVALPDGIPNYVTASVVAAVCVTPDPVLSASSGVLINRAPTGQSTFENGEQTTDSSLSWLVDVDVVSSDRHSGTYSLRATATAADWIAVGIGDFPVTAGEVLAPTIWVKAGQGGGRRFMLVASWLDDGDNVITGDNNFNDIATAFTTSWTFIACDVPHTAPVGTTHAKISINFTDSTAAAGETFFFDDFFLGGPIVARARIPLHTITTETPDATVTAGVVSSLSVVPLPDGIPNYVTAACVQSVAAIALPTLSTSNTIAAAQVTATAAQPWAVPTVFVYPNRVIAVSGIQQPASLVVPTPPATAAVAAAPAVILSPGPLRVMATTAIQTPIFPATVAPDVVGAVGPLVDRTLLGTWSSPFYGWWGNNTIYDIKWSPLLNKVVAINQKVATSDDGLTWDPQSWIAPTTHQWGISLTETSTALWALTDMPSIVTSTNGSTWTEYQPSELLGHGTPLKLLWVEGLGLFVLVTDHALLTSPDGTTWSVSKSSTDYWTDVAWSPELQLLVLINNGYENTIWTSPNAVDWTYQPSGADNSSATHVIWSEALQLFVVLDYWQGLLWRSSNGVDWYSSSSPFDHDDAYICDTPYGVAMGVWYYTSGINGYLARMSLLRGPTLTPDPVGSVVLNGSPGGSDVISYIPPSDTLALGGSSAWYVTRNLGTIRAGIPAVTLEISADVLASPVSATAGIALPTVTGGGATTVTATFELWESGSFIATLGTQDIVQADGNTLVAWDLQPYLYLLADQTGAGIELRITAPSDLQIESAEWDSLYEDTGTVDASFTPSVIHAYAAVPAATPSASLAFTATLVTATAALALPTFLAVVQLQPVPATATAVVPAPTPSAGLALTAEVVTATATAPSATAGAGQTASPIAAAAPGATIFVPTVTAIQNITITAVKVAVVAGQPSPTEATGSTVTQPVTPTTATIPLPTISTGGTVTAHPVMCQSAYNTIYDADFSLLTKTTLNTADDLNVTPYYMAPFHVVAGAGRSGGPVVEVVTNDNTSGHNQGVIIMPRVNGGSTWDTLNPCTSTDIPLTVSLWVRVTTGTKQVNVGYRWLGTDWSFVSEGGSDFTATTSWQKFTVTIPPTSAYFRVGAYAGVQVRLVIPEIGVTLQVESPSVTYDFPVVPAATAGAGQTVAASLITAVAAVPAPTQISVGVNKTAALITTTAAVLAPTSITAIQNINISAALIITAAGQPSPEESTGSTITSPSSVAGIAGVPTSFPSASLIFTAVLVTATSTVPLPDLGVGVSIIPVTIPVTSAIALPTFQYGNSVPAVTVAAVAALPVLTLVSANSNAVVGAVAAVAAQTRPAFNVSITATLVAPPVVTVPLPTCSAASNAAPTPVTAIAALPARTPSASSTVVAVCVVATAAVPTPTPSASIAFTAVLIAATGDQPSPLESAGSTIVQPVTHTIAAVPLPTIVYGNTVPAATVVVVGSVPTSTPSASSTVTPVPVAPPVATIGFSFITPNPQPVATAAVVPAPTVTHTATVVAVKVAAAAAVGRPDLAIGGLPAVHAVAALPAPTAHASTLVFQPTTVLAVASVVPPSLSNDANAVAARVAALTAVPTATVAVTATVVATNVPAAVSVPRPGLDATVTAAPVSAVAAVPAPVISEHVTIPAVLITATGAVPLPTIIAVTATYPVAVAAVTNVPAPAALSASTTIAATAVPAVAGQPSPTEATGSTITQPVIPAPGAVIPLPTFVITATVVAAPVSAVSAVTRPAFNVSITAAPVAALGILPSPTPSAGILFTAVRVAAPGASVPLPTFSLGATPTPSAITAVGDVPVPTLITSGLVLASTIAAIANQPSPLESAGSLITVSAALTFATIPAHAVAVGSTLAPAPVAATAAVPLPTFSTTSILTPTTVAAIAAVPTASVIATLGAAPGVVYARAAVPTAYPSANASFTVASVSAVSIIPSPTPSASSLVLAAAIQLTAALPSPVEAASSTVSASRIDAPAAMPAPTLSAGSRVVAVLVPATASIPTPSTTASSLVLANVLAAVGTVPSPTIGAHLGASPDTVGAIASVGVPVVAANSTVVASAVSTVSVVPAPTLSASSLFIQWTTIAAVANQPSPTESAGATIVASRIAVAASLGLPSFSTGSSVSGVTVNALVSVLLPTLSTGMTVADGYVAAIASVPFPTVATDGSVPPVTVLVTSIVPLPTLSTDQYLIAATIVAIAALPTEAASANANIAVTAAAATVAVGLPTFVTEARITAPLVAAPGAAFPPFEFSSSVEIPRIAWNDVVLAYASIPAPIVRQDASATPVTIASVAATYAPTVSASSLVFQLPSTTVAAIAAVPAPTPSAGVRITAARVFATATVPTPSISAGSSTTVSPSCVTATATVPPPTVRTSALFSVSTIAVTAHVPTTSLQTSSMASPATLSVHTHFEWHVLSAGILMAPDTVDTSGSVGGVTVRTGMSVATTTIPALAHVNSVAEVSVGSTLTLDWIRLHASIEPYTVSLAGDIIPNPVDTYAYVGTSKVIVTYPEGWGFLI